MSRNKKPSKGKKNKIHSIINKLTINKLFITKNIILNIHEHQLKVLTKSNQLHRTKPLMNVTLYFTF